MYTAPDAYTLFSQWISIWLSVRRKTLQEVKLEFLSMSPLVAVAAKCICLLFIITWDKNTHDSRSYPGFSIYLPSIVHLSPSLSVFLYTYIRIEVCMSSSHSFLILSSQPRDSDVPLNGRKKQRQQSDRKDIVSRLPSALLPPLSVCIEVVCHRRSCWSPTTASLPPLDERRHPRQLSIWDTPHQHQHHFVFFLLSGHISLSISYLRLYVPSLYLPSLSSHTTIRCMYVWFDVGMQRESPVLFLSSSMASVFLHLDREIPIRVRMRS